MTRKQGTCPHVSLVDVPTSAPDGASAGGVRMVSRWRPTWWARAESATHKPLARERALASQAPRSHRVASETERDVCPRNSPEAGAGAGWRRVGSASAVASAASLRVDTDRAVTPAAGGPLRRRPVMREPRTWRGRNIKERRMLRGFLPRRGAPGGPQSRRAKRARARRADGDAIGWRAEWSSESESSSGARSGGGGRRAAYLGRSRSGAARVRRRSRGGGACGLAQAGIREPTSGRRAYR